VLVWISFAPYEARLAVLALISVQGDRSFNYGSYTHGFGSPPYPPPVVGPAMVRKLRSMFSTAVHLRLQKAYRILLLMISPIRDAR
jgi:hypothetical protein